MEIRKVTLSGGRSEILEYLDELRDRFEKGEDPTAVMANEHGQPAFMLTLREDYEGEHGSESELLVERYEEVTTS